MLLVAVASRIEAGDPHARISEGREHSRRAGIQVVRPQETGNPSGAEGHLSGLPSDPLAGRAHVEGLAWWGRAGGSVVAGVRLPGPNPQAHHQVRGGFGSSVAVELGLLAEVVLDRQWGLRTCPERLQGRCGGAGPDPGFHGPTGQACAPFRVGQRDPRPVQSALLGGLVVLALEQAVDPASTTDRGVKRASGRRGAGCRLGPKCLLASVFQALPQLPEKAGLRFSGLLGQGGEAGDGQCEERDGSLSCVLHG